MMMGSIVTWGKITFSSKLDDNDDDDWIVLEISNILNHEGWLWHKLASHSRQDDFSEDGY